LVKECFQGKISKDKIEVIIELLHKELITSLLPRLRAEVDETKR